jgi:HEAT repeat protein
VREAAAESLGIMVTMGGASILEQKFRDRNESEDVRLAALESLNTYRQSSDPPLQAGSLLCLFRDALKDDTESVQIRSRAAHALAEAKDDSALELLVDVAKDKKGATGLRKEVIAALGAMGESKAVKPLIGLLNSPDVELKREAAKALEKLGDRSALKPLIMVLMNRDEDIYVRRLAGGGIVKIDRDRAFGPLVQIMNDNIETAPARRMAAEKIALLRDNRSTSLFVEVLKDKQQPWWLRRVAVNCLSKAGARVISTSRCIKALEAAADDADERVAKAARDALKRIPPQTSNQSLTKH